MHRPFAKKNLHKETCFLRKHFDIEIAVHFQALFSNSFPSHQPSLLTSNVQTFPAILIQVSKLCSMLSKSSRMDLMYQNQTKLNDDQQNYIVLEKACKLHLPKRKSFYQCGSTAVKQGAVYWSPLSRLRLKKKFMLFVRKVFVPFHFQQTMK